jgi:RNA polymerase sigma-70 factor, ECF subfamily
MSTPAVAEERLLERLRDGDQHAFADLVNRYSGSLLRLAMVYVPSRAVAEEVVQETWLGVLSGLDRFEGRSSLKTWLYRIAMNRAMTRGERERRTIPLSSLGEREATEDGPAIDPDRFLPADHERFPLGWAAPPRRWEESPERSLESAETLAHVRAAIAKLPPVQRLVISLRDLEGWESDEVRNALGLSQTNQRVLLHRARTRVRAALESYLADD